MLVQLVEVVQCIFLRGNNMSDEALFVNDIIEATRDGIIKAYQCTECNAVSYTHLRAHET